MSIQKRTRIVDVLAIAPKRPLVVDRRTPVGQTVDQMREWDTGCALVTDGGKLVGIFTARDVLNKVLGIEGALTRPVDELMTPDPVCLGETDSIHEAARRMDRGGFRHVPIVDADGVPVGVARHRDVIAYLVETLADRTLNLPPDPDQIATKPEGA